MESALLHPVGWMTIFPFLTGLGVRTGWGIAAPLIALGFCLPLFALSALFGRLVEVSARRFLPAPVRSVARGVLASLRMLVFVAYLNMPALVRWNLAPIGDWLDISRGIGWLLFADPVLVLTSLSEAPARAVSMFGVFLVEMTAAIALTALGLRRAYGRELIDGRRAWRGTRGSARLHRQLTRRRLFRGVVAKDLIWFRRNPARMFSVIFGAVLADVVVAYWLDKSGGWTPTRLGQAVLGVGVWLHLSLFAVTDEEQPALAQLATVPRSFSRMFADKSTVNSVLVCGGVGPLVVYGGRLLPSFKAALPALVYSGSALFVCGFIVTAQCVWCMKPDARAGVFEFLVRLVLMVTLVGFFMAGFAFPSLWRTLPLVILASAFAVTFWHDALARLPFALDPTTPREPRLSATYAIVSVVCLRFLNVQALRFVAAAGLGWWPSVVVSYALAGSVVVLVAISVLKLRRVSRLRRLFGVCLGASLRVTLREGVLWSVPAIAVNVAFGWLSQHWGWLDRAREESSHALRSALSTNLAWGLVLSTLAAPLVEELLFRGMLYRALRAQWSVLVSLLFSAAVFTVIHPAVGAVPIFCMAACATLAFERSQSLLSAVLVHALYNAFISCAILIGSFH